MARARAKAARAITIAIDFNIANNSDGSDNDNSTDRGEEGSIGGVTDGYYYPSPVALLAYEK